MRRYVTIHPVGHEPADSLVLAGVIRAVWAVHEVPVVLDREADGSITVADLPVPTLQVVQEPDLDEDSDDEPEVEPEPERPAPKPAPASTPRRGGARQKVTDDELLAAVRQHGPIGISALCELTGLKSTGTMHVRLTKLAKSGQIENVGRAWRATQAKPSAEPRPRAATNGTTPTAVPATNGTAPAAVPAKPGGVVATGPIERRPFDPEAARLRAAGEA